MYSRVCKDCQREKVPYLCTYLRYSISVKEIREFVAEQSMESSGFLREAKGINSERDVWEK